MTATNHALTGAAIGLIVGDPILAVPLALASHFICDAIPHFGIGSKQAAKINKYLRKGIFRNYLIVEAMLCFLIVLGLAILRPEHWQLAAVCAFVAASPDLISARRYFAVVRHQQFRPNLYERFATAIQWFERPIGAVVEVVWFAAALIVISPYLH